MKGKNQITETPEQQKNREMTESIANNIAKLAESVQVLLNGQLKRKALIILLANSSGQSQTSVTEVLKALENLKSDWLNK